MSLNLSSNFPEFKIVADKTYKQAVYEFDEFRLDATKLMLYRAGREIALPPKVIETLLVLIENRGEIVGKDDLMNRVWADAIVEESNLSQCLYRLRKTLGNQPDGAPYIETFRRRGYRFNGDARVSEKSNGFSTPEKREDAGEQVKSFAANGNGESAMKIASPRQFRVERRGNILALADWTEGEKNSDAGESAEPQIPNPEISNFKSNYRFVIAAAAVILLAIILFIQYKPASNFAASSAPADKKELTFLRLTNGIAAQDAAISPDGNYFAYSEYDGETMRLIVQQTGQSHRLEIVPSSERKILGKTFSPDGAFLYFLVQDKPEEQLTLYRVPTLGGVQTKILENVASPISFSPDGREMVFHRWNRQAGESALIIAASDGGAERILQKRDGGQEVLLHPAWSPDGATIAFAVLYPQGSPPAFYKIHGINLQTGEIVPLSPENWETCYRIVWLRDGAGLVFVGTKNGESLSTRRDNIFYLSASTGEARRLTVDGNRYQLFSLGVTDDDSIIAVPNSNLSQIWQMSPGGDSRSAIQITNGSADGRVGIAPLADGRVGYITRTGENLHLWLMNHDGTIQKQLTNDQTYIEELRAAPDGGYFIFSAHRDRASHLFRIDADGSNLRQLTFGDNREIDSSISPDGNWIVYDSAIFDGTRYKHALWKISSAGGEPVRISDADCAVPHFSPDGKFLSCIRHEKEILVVSAETGEIVKTFAAVQPAVLNNGAHWTRDGQNLVYKVYREKVSNLWLQPTTGAAARPLTDFTANGVWNFTFSIDGSRLYVVRAYQINDAVLIKNFR